MWSLHSDAPSCQNGSTNDSCDGQLHRHASATWLHPATSSDFRSHQEHPWMPQALWGPHSTRVGFKFAGSRIWIPPAKPTSPSLNSMRSSQDQTPTLKLHWGWVINKHTKHRWHEYHLSSTSSLFTVYQGQRLQEGPGHAIMAWVEWEGLRPQGGIV